MRAYLRRMFLVLVVTFSVHAQENIVTLHPLLGKIVDVRGQFVKEQIALDMVRQRSYIFVGEKHDNSEHHQLERRLIQERFKEKSRESQGRVVFEMLDSSHEAAIVKLQVNDSPDQMKIVLNWPAKGGWDWAAYSPSFQEALKNSALAAGNIDRAFINTVYRNGDKSFSDLHKFSTAIDPPEHLKNYLLDQIFASHCGMQSRETLTPMLHIQLAKDASMASAMAETKGAMLIAGGEHVRSETGAPWHLRKKQANANILVIQIVEVQAGKFDALEYIKKVGAADLYWFTGATETKDYCAGVKGKAAQ